MSQILVEGDIMQNMGKYKTQKMQPKSLVLFLRLIIICALAGLGWVGSLMVEIIKGQM
jgi:hypothetical protein